MVYYNSNPYNKTQNPKQLVFVCSISHVKPPVFFCLLSSNVIYETQYCADGKNRCQPPWKHQGFGWPHHPEVVGCGPPIHITWAPVMENPYLKKIKYITWVLMGDDPPRIIEIKKTQ